MITQMTYLLALKVAKAVKVREDSFNRRKAQALREAGVISAEGFLPCYDKTLQEAAAEACPNGDYQAKPVELMLLGDFKAAKAWADMIISEHNEQEVLTA
jgi:hypothetical protein